MPAYVLRRSLATVPVIVGTVSLLFLLLFVVPGDPVEELAGGRAVSPSARAAIEDKYGLDQPWHVQYGRYWQRLAQGDLGESYQQGRSVGGIVRTAAPASLRLAVWALAIEVGIGVAAGALSTLTGSPFVTVWLRLSTAALLAVPVFLLGYLLQYGFGIMPFRWGWPAWSQFPVQGVGPDSWSLLIAPTSDQWRFLLLPAFTLAAAHSALLARVTYASLAEALQADHIKTARAKGLPARTVLTRHGLRVGLPPVLSVIGIDLGGFLGSAIITETVFNWPGIGSAMYRAVTALDSPVVLGLTLVVVLTHVAVALIVDITHALLDPRVRVELAQR